MFVTLFQTITEPDKTYVNYLRFFWFLFQIYSSDILTKMGNFIQNTEEINYSNDRPLNILAVMWVLIDNLRIYFDEDKKLSITPKNLWKSVDLR